MTNAPLGSAYVLPPFLIQHHHGGGKYRHQSALRNGRGTSEELHNFWKYIQLAEPSSQPSEGKSRTNPICKAADINAERKRRRSAKWQVAARPRPAASSTRNEGTTNATNADTDVDFNAGECGSDVDF